VNFRHIGGVALLFSIGVTVATTSSGCSDVGDNTSFGGGDSGSDVTLAGDAAGDDGGLGPADAGGMADAGNGSSPDAAPGTGADAEAGADADALLGQADAPPEAGPDAAPDVGGVGPDSGPDGGGDAGVDSSLDAPVDVAPPPPDAPAEAAPDSPADAPLEAPGDAPAESGACTAQTVHASCNAYVAANVATNFNSSGSTCTPTEDVLFQLDGTGQCLACLFGAGCLDDTLGDSAQECSDTASFTSHGGTEAECLAAIACGLGVPTSGCARAASNPPAMGSNLNAYCGAEAVSTCESSGPIGACASQETAGFGGLTPANIVSNFGNRAYASGMANGIFACGHVNCATPCGL
jgi:hypothetical protein